MNEFNYGEAVAELERLAAKVEDPSVGLPEIDSCIKRSEELVAACRGYLRGMRTKMEEMDR